MAWIYVPALGELSSACPLPSPDTEVCATWRGKPIAHPYSWRGWRKRRWTSRLFGAILQPSMADRGVALWISSLRDSRASPTASPENNSDGTTLDATTLSHTHSGSSKKCSPPWYSSKMYQPGLLEDIFDQSEIDYQNWVTRLRQDCSQRRKLAQATDESDVLSWATPQAHDCKNGSVDRVGRFGTIAGCRNLNDEVWNTPTANDMRQREGTATGNRLNYPGLFRQAQAATGTESPLTLNPQFVEWLMGFPIGWTDCERSETPWCPWLQRMRLELSRLLRE